jgi:nucleotide-binding universal stress UspA family protein
MHHNGQDMNERKAMITTQNTFIVWAIDPFTSDPNLQLHMAPVLRGITMGGGAQIDPVSVLLPDQFDTSSGKFLESSGELVTNARKNVTRWIRAAKLPSLGEPTFLSQKSHSTRQAVKKLIEHAIATDADIIAVSTHASKGAARIILGSFAETLILQSPLPVLVSNPTLRFSGKIKRILFPTDLTEKSREVFSRVLELAKKWNARVLIWHKPQYLFPELAYPFIVPVVATETVKELEKQVRDEAQAWVETAGSRGVLAEFHVDRKAGDIAKTLLKTANKLHRDTVVVMASQSGALASMLLGSTSRYIVRNAKCPVLVLHPKAVIQKEKSKEKTRPANLREAVLT